MHRKKIRKETLLMEGLKHFTPLKHTEFICPVCGGIATIGCENQLVVTECHACSTNVLERYGDICIKLR